MKIKTISRSFEEHTRPRAHDLKRMHRNLAPEEHPFERPREYIRALNATKLERLFAKPFMAALTGHRDGVYCMAKHPTQLTALASGSADGEIRLWSLQQQETRWSAIGHRGFVRGVCFVPNTPSSMVSVGDDKVVRLWDGASEEPTETYTHNSPFTGVDHHRWDPVFATSASQVDVWDHNRAEPIMSLSWGAETITSVKFNQTETNVIASSGSDRTITLYDIRTSQPISKVVLALRSNAIAWNPMEAYMFTVANEDHNLYTFDMRNLTISTKIYKDHVSAVLDLDYSPTGQQIVSGSYDRSIRIFDVKNGTSRDIYSTKRMQKIFCVKYTMDSKFVLSGSDDGNIRLWKAEADAKLGALAPREEAAFEYKKALKERYKYMPQLKAIDKQRQIPKAIVNAKKTKDAIVRGQSRRERNNIRNSAPGTVPEVHKRKKHIVAVRQ
ncbi:WD40-repeat-containing domain protein [Zopfochytrium polystomum]|nr:WD40-repeat-containing domain protein [Zopfochytrium polystomum]